jgi:hypothetical protein
MELDHPEIASDAADDTGHGTVGGVARDPQVIRLSSGRMETAIYE